MRHQGLGHESKEYRLDGLRETGTRCWEGSVSTPDKQTSREDYAYE